jgi:[ribosomal protein S5]-alanine N-acetyltransferase
MNHLGTIEIETERLCLRKFLTQDDETAYRNWTSDNQTTAYLRWPTHASLEVTQRVLSDWIASYSRKDFYQWAIVLKALGEPIGTISVVDQNERVNSVHIGYCIGSKWWNQGITTEAFRAIIPYLFNKVKVNRIEAQHDPNNPGSGKVMQKCGLKYEGTLREADFSNKGIVDAAMYSLLASEYNTEKP